jgi:hypothetical protein
MPRNIEKIRGEWRDNVARLLGDGPPLRLENNKFRPALPSKQGEELFQHILSGIREVYDVEATIAGGAVRDLAAGYLNLTKDVDVFIPMEMKKFQEVFDELGWKALAIIPSPYKGIKNTSEGRAMSNVCGMIVDLVFMPKGFGWEQINQFPIHAQRCAWTLKDGVELAAKAANDLNNKTFTIDPTITDRERVAKFVEKLRGLIKRGYTDWKIVEPGKVEEKVRDKELVVTTAATGVGKYTEFVMQNGHMWRIEQ